MNLKKIGFLLSSSALTFGMFASVANASTTTIGQPDKVQIQVASTETVFSKNDLIKRFRALFPNQFDFLSDSDFRVENSYFYPEDDTLRYGLSFFKTIGGKQINGHIGFVGENLEIEQFYYQPSNEAEALFPPRSQKRRLSK